MTIGPVTTDHGLVRVAVVRPTVTAEQIITRLLVALTMTAVSGWWLMLIAGTVAPWKPSYWHTVLILIGLRLVQVGSSSLGWTHPAKAGRR